MINEFENKTDLNSTQENLPSAPDLPLLEKLKKKKLVIICGSLVLAILLIGLVGFYYFKSQTPPSPEQTPSVAKEQNLAQYIKREKILETAKYQWNSDIEATSGEDWELDIYDFYKVGIITSGKYKDGDLLVALFKPGGPNKGPSAGKSVHLRFVKKGNMVTFLTKISHPLILTTPDGILKVNPFKKFGFSLTVDNNATIPILEYPIEIHGNSPRQILKAAPEYPMEEDGEVDSSKLYKAFTHPIYGDIYTTKVEFSPSRSFEPEGQGGAFGSGIGMYGCRNTSCFTTNQFFTFRPDGTFLRFNYNPDISVKDILWTDNKKTVDEYTSNTVAGCSRQELDNNSIVASSSVDNSDLVVIGKASNKGDTVYGLKDQRHKLYTEFYNTYKEYYAGPYIYPEEKIQTKSFSEFINSRPIFLWGDPFGRLIRFNNEEFLPPFACEPVIYLYPKTSQKVSITFDRKVHLSDSTPKYNNGWNVIVAPSGEILNLSDYRTYPYLFWEGWSLIFPIQRKGFVIKQSEVTTFLEKTLPKLGLNEQEKKDFMKAWLPYFSDSPYYFIAFLDQDVIDKITPLKISPSPDTIIRVLMDIKPLEKPIDVIEPNFETVPQRTGFTVVEWGGLKR